MANIDRRGITVGEAEPAVSLYAHSGVAQKAACVCATTENITLSGLQTIDGVTVTEGQRVLVKDQSTASENGIYNASSGNWQRAGDFDGAGEVAYGTWVAVIGGAANAVSQWYVATANPIVIDTTSIVFSRLPAFSVVADRTELKARDTGNSPAFCTEDWPSLKYAGYWEWDATIPVSVHQSHTDETEYVAPETDEAGAWVKLRDVSDNFDDYLRRFREQLYRTTAFVTAGEPELLRVREPSLFVGKSQNMATTTETIGTGWVFDSGTKDTGDFIYSPRGNKLFAFEMGAGGGAFSTKLRLITPYVLGEFDGSFAIVSCTICMPDAPEGYDQFVWMKNVANGGDWGHGSKLVTREPRTIWQIVKFHDVSSYFYVDAINGDPSDTWGSPDTNVSSVYFFQNAASLPYKIYAGEFQITPIPDPGKIGIVTYGDSTVSGGQSGANYEDRIFPVVNESAGPQPVPCVRWLEGYTNRPVFNAGEGGNNSADLDSEWATHVSPRLENADTVIVFMTLNDFKNTAGDGVTPDNTVEDIKANYDSMLAKAQSDGFDNIVFVGYPTWDLPDAYVGRSDDVLEVEEYVRSIAPYWIPGFRHPATKPDRPDEALAGTLADTIHPNRLGSQLWGHHLGSHYNRLFPALIIPQRYVASVGGPSEPVETFGYGKTLNEDADVAGTGTTFFFDRPWLHRSSITLTGQLTGNRVVALRRPYPFEMTIFDATTDDSGPYTLTIQVTNASNADIQGGAGFQLTRGKGAKIICDGSQYHWQVFS